MRTTSDRAHTLLELLVSISVGSILLMAGTAAFSNLSSIRLRIHHLRKAEYQHARMQRILQHVIQDYDSHRFALEPQVHSRTRLTTAGKTLNSYLQLKKEKMTVEGSDALSAAFPDLKSTLYVKRLISHSNNFLMVLACRRFPNQFQNFDNHGFIGVSNDDFVFLDGRLARNQMRRNCARLRLQQRESLILPERPSSSLAFIRQLLPLADHYTIYLDLAGNLRRITHFSSARSQNQPLLSNIASFHISNFAWGAPKLYGLSFRFQAEAKREFVLSSASELQRILPHNFLMNIPYGVG